MSGVCSPPEHVSEQPDQSLEQSQEKTLAWRSSFLLDIWFGTSWSDVSFSKLELNLCGFA